MAAGLGRTTERQDLDADYADYADLSERKKARRPAADDLSFSLGTVSGSSCTTLSFRAESLVVIPSGSAKRWSRGIAIVLGEGPLPGELRFLICPLLAGTRVASPLRSE